MNKMSEPGKIKAIFFDVDGTLLSHSISDVPASARKALRLLHEQGKLLFLATGRHRRELEKLPVRDLPFDGYLTMTGHLCYDAHWQPVLSRPLPPEIRAGLDRMFQEKQLPLIMVHEGISYINYADHEVERCLRDVSTAPPKVGTLLDLPVFGAVFFGQRERVQQLIDRSLPGCGLTSWHPEGFDLMTPQTGKELGIQELMKQFHLSREEIMAFGDGDNDAEMLSFAGIGVAMGNGSKQARESADYVTDSIDDDGLWNALVKLCVL